MAELALSDVRVLDLSRGIAGAYASKLLADYGADVIKVEPPEGDPVRRLGPFPDDVPDPEMGGLFLFLNTNKRSLTLDVSTVSGQVVLRKLLPKADVLIEDGPPGTMHGRELGYEDLHAGFPRLVYASVTPFGLTGPYRDFKGNSLTAMAQSGVMYATGAPDREPLTTGGDPAEFLAGLQLWAGILAALADRDASGEGQLVDVSMAEAAAASDEYNSAMYSFQGAIRRRYYSRHTFGYPSDILPCKDGYVTVVPGAAGWPDAMALVFERPEWAEHELFTNVRERVLRWREFDEMVQPYLMSHTAEEIVARAQELRLPFALVPLPADLLSSRHLAERGFFQEVEHPKAGVLRLPGAPFVMSETPARPGRAPLRGEHNAEILTGDAGYELPDLTILSDRGVT